MNRRPVAEKSLKWNYFFNHQNSRKRTHCFSSLYSDRIAIGFIFADRVSTLESSVQIIMEIQGAPK